MKSPAWLERILACPDTHEPLRFVAPDAVATPSGRRYAVLDGVPVLRPGPVEPRPLDHVSNEIGVAIRDFMLDVDGPVLLLGAGATTFRAEHVFELEYNPFRNTDVVGDAHLLPVVDDSLAAVVALNVFEHLADPDRAAGEINRALRPGGHVLIHTAFLQHLHESPHHYYNATEFGARRWFRAFTKVQVTVTPNFNPFFGLSWYCNDLLYLVRQHLGEDAYQRLSRAKVGDLAEFWATRQLPPDNLYELFRRLPDDVQRTFAAGFQLEARKGGA